MVSHSVEAPTRSRFADPGSWALAPVLVCGLFAFRGLFLTNPAGVPPSDIVGAEEWLFSPSGGSPWLVFVLTAWFVVRRLPRLRGGFGVRGHAFPGVAGLALSGLGVLWAHWVGADQVLAPSLAIALVSVGAILGAREGAGAMCLPAVFLILFATPIPTPLLNAVVHPLQVFTATTVTWMADAVGLEARRSGVLILTPATTFYVIETCAGLRTMLTLALTAFVYAEVFHRSRLRLAMLLACSLGIGLMMNLGRVLSLVAVDSGPDQPGHTLQGLVMVVGGVLLLSLCDRLLGRFVRERGPVRRSTSRRPAPVGSIPVRRIVGVSVALALLGGLTLWIPTRPTERHDHPTAHDVPRDLGEWTMKPPALEGDEEFMGSTRYSSRTWRLYENDGAAVELYLGLNDRRRRYTGLVSSKTEVLRPGSRVASRRPLTTGWPGANARELVVVDVSGARWLVHHAYENVGSLWTETWRNALGVDRGPWRRREPARVVRLATRTDVEGSSIGTARRRLLAFRAELDDALERLRTSDSSPAAE